MSDSIDTSKLGIAAAKAMDRIERLYDAGDITDDYELAEVLVIVAFNRPAPDPPIEPDRIETFVFIDGTTQILYQQLGLIGLAEQVTRESGPVVEDDQEEDDDDGSP